MRLDDLLDDSETEAGAAAGGIGGVFLENFGEHLKRDAGAVIADGALDRAIEFAGGHDDAAASGILESVAEQVLEDLREEARRRRW